MQIAATRRIPDASGFSAPFSLKKQAADPSPEPAARTIATTGVPPASHERATRSITRVLDARSTSADRMARYKVIRHAGPHGRCAAPHVSERRATIDMPRGAGMPSCPRRLDVRNASLPAWAANLFSRRAAWRNPLGTSGGVGQGHNSGSTTSRKRGLHRRSMGRCLMPALEWDFKSSRASTQALPGRRLSASTPGTSVPLAWLRRELPAMLRSASRFGDWTARSLHVPACLRDSLTSRAADLSS